MSLIVQKFGGTSVGTPERVRSIAQRISQTYAEGHQLVVVVSAMGHTTDELIDLAHQVSRSPAHREMDMLLSAGERISMALLSMALVDLRVPAISLTGSQSGIITDQSHRRARIRRILGGRVRTALANGSVVIVAGFQGVSESKEITTLGRGGSDTTAVALAAELRADICEIFTDVDGVYTSDPRVVPQAKLLKTISHDLMVEMATRGAGVLHSRSVELAQQYDVPLKVRNSLNGNEGTSVKKQSGHEFYSTGTGMEEFGVTGISADASKVLIHVTLARATVVSALWEKAAGSHLSILSPIFLDSEVRFFSDGDGEMEWRKHLEQLIVDGFVKQYEISPDIIPLSVIGNRFSQDGSALQQIIETLAAVDIHVRLATASSLAVTLGVSKNRVNEGLRALHKFFLEPQVPTPQGQLP